SIRSFMVHTDHGYQVMPGGLVKSATASGQLIISNQRSGVAKDLWVVAKSTEKHSEKIASPHRLPLETALSSRSAENLFWVGRYAERTLSVTTLLDHILIELNIHQNDIAS